MAEEYSGVGQDGCRSVAVSEDREEDAVNTEASPASQAVKRCSTSPNTSLSMAPPHKSPRMETPVPSTQGSGTPEETVSDQQMNEENTEGPSGVPDSPTSRRKSWRRATLTRRSLPSLPNPYQVLCRGISTTLSQQERLEKLMEASMKLAVERTQKSLECVPENSLDCFKKQVEHIEKEWGCLAKSICSEAPIRQSSSSSAAAADVSSSDPAAQRATEKVHNTINRLQAECRSWEELLNKHRSKAEELKRKVEQGQDGGISLDSAARVAQSSQHLLIRSKPDYHGLLRRQQPQLHTISMIMDTQCKIVRELLSIRENSQLVVKETSRRLAAEAGFQDLSPDSLRNLMAATLSAART